MEYQHDCNRVTIGTRSLPERERGRETYCANDATSKTAASKEYRTFIPTCARMYESRNELYTTAKCTAAVNTTSWSLLCRTEGITGG